LNREDTVRFKMLDGVPLVLPTGPSSVRLLLDQLAKRAGIRLNITIEADSAQIQKAVARQGGAYAVLPVHAAADEIDAGTLVASRIVEPEIHRTIVLGVTVARPAARATRETAKAIRAIMTGKESLFHKPRKAAAR
jgi:DNA-binding transcriptional LysR family regulator